jgi:hypothetical protein
MLFAASPGSSQATTWISAQGDQLAVAFMAWAALSAQEVAIRGASTGRVVRFALAVALATASKDVAWRRSPPSVSRGTRPLPRCAGFLGIDRGIGVAVAAVLACRWATSARSTRGICRPSRSRRAIS